MFMRFGQIMLTEEMTKFVHMVISEGNKSLYLWSLWGCVGLQHVGLQHLIFLQHALAPLLP